MVRGGSVWTVLALVAILLTGCTDEGSEPPEPDNPTDAALRVTTLSRGGLDEDTGARLESEVSEVLADYVAAGYLGDYPRSDFVQAFEDFTSGAAEQAVVDIDVLTASRFSKARSVTATDLGAELSFFVVGDAAVGVSAWVDFSFDVDDEGTAKRATMEGRLTLERRNDQWSVFGYDVRRDDSDAVPSEASTP